MERAIPRVMLAGTNSGCGKTTVTCAILQALVNRGLRVGAFKCGPDYIDPMFHSRIIGAKSANLDLHFFSENTLRYLLAKNAPDRDVSIMEGVMGYYDGLGLTTTRASSWEVAKAIDAPTVLVVNARGASLSILAVIQGFLSFCPDHHIQGVLLNGCSPSAYPMLAQEIEKRLHIRTLGYLPQMRECTLESRHLGLVTAAEVEDLHEKTQALARQAEKTIDLQGILEIAGAASPIACDPVAFPRMEPVRIAVAQDKAFCFYYGDNLRALEEMGAELIPFSPLQDRTLPPVIHGLYLGGGYPELYAQSLSQNTSMRESTRQALQKGVPCIAECGGFMYLTQEIGGYPMVGFLPGTCFDTGKLTRFGYVTLRAKEDNLLGPQGCEIPAHEFHHWDCTQPGSAFTAEKISGKQWDCAVATDRLYAGFPHFHFYANPDFAVSFYRCCIREKHQHDRFYQANGH